MSTMTGDREGDSKPGVVRDLELNAMPRCTRCNLRYTPTKSTSALRLTYCSFLCELGDLGFSMAGLEHMERAPRAAVQLPAPAPEPEPAAAR